ncbi:MAG: acyl-CoA dehydrogenase family protein [Alphaproteobacteria bacterium]
MTQNPTPALSAAALVARARELAAELAPRAAEIDAARRVPAEVIERLRAAELFAALQPRAYGGAEIPLADYMTMVMHLAETGGSLGWVFSVLALHQWNVALFAREAQDEVWRDPHALVASSYAPAGPIERDGNGWAIRGRWSFASGCDNATWSILGGLLPGEGGTPQRHSLFLVPKRDYRIDDNWHVLGLRGTGSKDIVIERAVVPAHRVLTIADVAAGMAPGTALHGNTLYKLPFWSVVPYSLASPGIGIARGCLKAFVGDMRTRAKRGTGTKVAQFPTLHLRVAEATAAVDAAQTVLLTDAVLLQKAAANNAVDVSLRLRIRRNHAYALKLARQGIEQLADAAGAAILRDDHPMQRPFRDLRAVSAHISMNWDAAGTAFGAASLGLNPEGATY